MNFSQTITIHSTLEKIWGSLTEFEKTQEWNDCLINHETISQGPIQPGFKSKTLIREGKKEQWYEEEILEFVPFERVKIKLLGKNLGKNPMISEYQLKETANGIQVTHTVNWEPSGLFLKLLHKPIEKMSKKNTDMAIWYLPLDLLQEGPALGGDQVRSFAVNVVAHV